MKKIFCEELRIIGRGVGQVFFQNNALSGLLILAGIACNAWSPALMALAGNIAGVLTARLSEYPDREIRDGLYGFNGTLVGIAAGVFLRPGTLPLTIMLITAALSTPVARLFVRAGRLPGFTAPFILCVWTMLAVCHWFAPSLLLTVPTAEAETSALVGRAFCLHLGQVMFQDKTCLCGLLFLAGIAVNSRTNALYAVWGATLPLATIWLCEADYAAFNAGMLGYNGVLAAIATGDRTRCGFGLATLAVVLATALQLAGGALGLTTLTAPFVLAVWTVLGIRHISYGQVPERLSK